MEVGFGMLSATGAMLVCSGLAVGMMGAMGLVGRILSGGDAREPPVTDPNRETNAR